RTDAKSIHVHYKVTKPALAMPHMPATGVSGADLYARDGQGRWRWVNVTRPAAGGDADRVDRRSRRHVARVRALPPLYNGVQSLELACPRAPLRGLGPASQADRVLRHLHHARGLRQPARHGPHGGPRSTARRAGGEPRLSRATAGWTPPWAPSSRRWTRPPTSSTACRTWGAGTGDRTVRPAGQATAHRSPRHPPSSWWKIAA
ncbi:hypothetical protein EMGBD4_15400, partial [Verrucomicrobiota bacterium]